MQIALLLIPMFFTLLSTPVSAVEFTDVSPDSSHYLAISTLGTNGVIDGYEDGSYKPKQKITRAEAVKMMVIALYPEEKENMKNFIIPEITSFTDAYAGDWYTPYLEFAKSKELISGYEDGSFHPDQTINLAETLKIFLAKKANLTSEEISANLFEDTPADSWFTPYTAYAGKLGLIEIPLSNKIDPNQEVTRSVLAELIYREDLSQDGYGFGKATYYGSAIDGHKTSSGEIFYSSLYTAAHKTLPFGTIVEVTNLANGQSVQVKINDRGPYGAGRVLDLSSGAFSSIAWLGSGVINVQYKVISSP